MLDHVDGEGAGEPKRQHLGTERAGEFGPIGDRLAVGEAELPASIDRRRAHQIPDRAESRALWLMASGEAIRDVLE